MADQIENKGELEALTKKNPTVVLLAHANYSAPSRTFKTDFNDVARDKAVEGKLAFAWFDAFDAEDINSDLMVRTFPAYFVYKDGNRVKSTLSANATKEQLAADVAELGS